jgi:hypothetical protein
MFWVTVFAHELIHIEHPHWPHWKVYRWDDWYGRVVVGPAIRNGNSDINLGDSWMYKAIYSERWVYFCPEWAHS